MLCALCAFKGDPAIVYHDASFSFHGIPFTELVDKQISACYWYRHLSLVALECARHLCRACIFVVFAATLVGLFFAAGLLAFLLFLFLFLCPFLCSSHHELVF